MDASAQHIGDVRAEFTGNARRFFRIALIGNLLQIPTVGFYRFWLITDIRRHLWSHTRLGGDAFEYTGRGRELLIGFLIAMAILMPIYIGYFILSIEAERWQAFASLPLFLIIYVLMHYGTYRARRYRATRTIFRGVRFWMTGSGWAYAGRAILWDLLTMITLGVALPWRMAALERYKMQNTRFGDLNGAFVGTGWTLFKRGWWLWLLAFLPLAVLIGFAGYLMTYTAIHQYQPLDKQTIDTVMGTGATVVPVSWLFAFSLFQAVKMRWWLEGVHIGELALSSQLKKRSVFWCYFKATIFGFIFIVLCIGLLIASLLGMGIPAIENPDGWQISANSPAGIAAFVVFYLIFVLGLSIIVLQFITRGVWRLTTNSVTVFNIATLDAATARGLAAGSVGEGLADALDFGGGIGV